MPLTGEYEPSTNPLALAQVEKYEATDGVEGGTTSGLPVIVLTSLGAKSGKIRKTALMRVEHDGRYAVVGSLGGEPKNPVWVYNLRAEPHVELQDGAVKRDYLAHEAVGAEREEWWGYAVDAFPKYGRYQEKTDREIPLFVLTPIED